MAFNLPFCPGSSWFCPAQNLSGLYLGLLSLLQAGADGREGEGCGTVGLLLEHSFEIGEFSVFEPCTYPVGPNSLSGGERVERSYF